MLLNNPEQLTSPPVRIISLVPSQTELLYALGLEQETLAITKFCIHPYDWFDKKLKIGGTKALHLEKIESLQPDLIIANKEENVKEQVEWLAEKFPVWLTDVNDVNGALGMINDLGRLTHKEKEATGIIQEIENRFDKWKVAEKEMPRMKAAYLIWKDPFMTVGGDTFIHSMLDLAGFDNVFGWQDRYPEVSMEELRNSGCRVLLLSSEPYPFAAKHMAEFSEMLEGVRVITVDGEIFSWYGSKMIQSTDYFRKLRLDLETGA
jgi:ABC-type Fe3+-hydroxamate transport system substrate-binding protein